MSGPRDPHAARAADSGIDLETRADALKERIYVTFSVLAVVLTLLAHPEDTTRGGAAITLVLVTVGTLLAVTLADVIAHITVHAKLPTRAEGARMAQVASSSLGVIVLPLILVAASALFGWSLESALRASVIALLVALVAVGWIAVRRVVLPWWQRMLVLLAEAALGALVLVLQIASHA